MFLVTLLQDSELKTAEPSPITSGIQGEVDVPIGEQRKKIKSTKKKN